MHSMKVHSVEVVLLSAALDAGAVRNAQIAKGPKPTKEAILCRIRSECGVLGECYVTLLGASGAEVANLVTNVFAPLLRGMDGGRPAACWVAMEAYTRRSYWNRAAALRAMACLDGALWDAVGRQAGLPLHRLWGGASERMPVVVMDSRWHPDEPQGALNDRMAGLQESGYAGCKLKVGVHSPFGPLADAKRLCLARTAVGSGFALFADANQGWTPAQALEFARAAQDATLQWLEEPCHWPDDRRGMARVRATGLVPVCAGQMESTAQACRDLVEEGAIDVCNADASFCGVSVWLQVAAVAACSSIDMVQHMEPQLGVALAGSFANGRHVEVYDASADPFWYGMIANRPRSQNGVMELPTEPGWGWVLDEDFVRAHRVDA